MSLVDGVLPLEDEPKPSPIVQGKVDVVKPKPIGAHIKRITTNFILLQLDSLVSSPRDTRINDSTNCLMTGKDIGS